MKWKSWKEEEYNVNAVSNDKVIRVLMEIDQNPRKP